MRSLQFASASMLMAVLLGAVTGCPRIDPDEPPTTPGLTKWFPIGPAPIDNYEDGVSGRASAIAVNPSNSDDVWLGTAAGGVWHSRDGGDNWEPLGDKQDVLAIGALALDGCDAAGCTTVYAGTGENAIRRDTYHGAGLLIGTVTADQPAQVSWTLREGTPYDFRPGSINDVVLDPTTSGADKRIFVTLSSGVTVSGSEATVTAPEPAGGYGIYRSDDNGESWSKLTVSGSAEKRPTDLEMDPEDENVLYAGILGRGIYKSTDKGSSWCPLNEGIALPEGCLDTSGLPHVSQSFDFVEIATAPSDPSILYATFGHCEDRLINSCQPSLYRSADGGLTWSELFAGEADPDAVSFNAPLASYSRYTHALAVKPDDPDWVLLGGVLLWRTEDGGLTFVQSDDHALVPSGGPQFIHPDHREIVFATPTLVYGVNDGGFNVSSDAGSSWAGGNQDLQITGFQGLGASSLTGAVIGTSQDNGTALWTGYRQWSHLMGGDGGFSALDRDDVLTMYTMINYGTPLRSTDGGISWNWINSSIPDTAPRLFYAPLVQGAVADASGEHPLYFGADRLYRSTDNGDNWTVVSPVLATGPEPEIVTSPSPSEHSPRSGVNVISAIAVSADDPDRVWVGYYGGEVFRTGDLLCNTLSCWERGDTGLPGDPVTHLAAHPGDRQTAWVTLSGFDSGPKLFKTTNGGAQWNPSATGLPAGVPANSIAVESSNPNTLYVGLDSSPTGASLYRSTDGGETWRAFAGGLPNAPVYQIVVDETHGRLYAATHGRGAWVLGDAFIFTRAAWVNGSISDIEVGGHNFPPNGTCVMQILQANGDVCASGTVDAKGGTFGTDGSGSFVTDNPPSWENSPLTWACFDGTCLGNTPVGECSDDADGDGDPDPLSTIVVSCDGALATSRVPDCPSLDNPPSSVVQLGLAGLGDADPLTNGGGAPPPPTIGSREPVEGGETRRLLVTASVQRREGTESLCSVSVPFSRGEAAEAVLGRMRDAVNENRTCAGRSVNAVLDLGPQEFHGEDVFPRAPRLLLRAPKVKGGQLVTALHANPGDATGVGLKVDALGVPVLSQLRSVEVGFRTPPAGAAGGEVTLIERTPLGRCELTVSTRQGQPASNIATALAASKRGDARLEPNPRCPMRRNPRDMVTDGNSLRTVAASGLELRINDPAVGFTLRPEALANVHPVADAVMNRETRGSFVLDGSGSVDPDFEDDIASWEWLDATAEWSRPLGSGERLEISLEPGTYRIRLVVHDRGGLSDTDEVTITVTE